MKHITALLVSTLFVLGCQAAKQPEPKTEVQVEKPWNRLDDQKVSFVRMHPGAPQKNTYIDWEVFQNPEKPDEISLRVDDKPVSAEAAQMLDNLKLVVGQDLIPSNGIYTCRYQENQPQYRLEFHSDGHHYKVVSSSDCLNAAPFNVEIDGKLFLQMNGKIGVALQNVLQASGSSLSVGGTPGMIQLKEPITVDGYAQDGTLPNAYYDDLMRKDESLGKMLDAFAPMTVDLPEIACNQSKKADCSEISARYTIHVADNAYIYHLVKISGESVSHTSIDLNLIEKLKKIRETYIFNSYLNLHKEDSIQIYPDKNQDCKLVSGLAKFFSIDEKDIKSISCHTWTFTVKDQPSLIYYEGLDAFWPEQNSEHQYPLLQYYCENKKLPKDTIQSICKKFKPDAGTNLFIRANDKVVKFVKKNGQTILSE